MFVFLATVLCLALIRFGGNVPEAWFGLGILFATATLVWMLKGLRSGESLDTRFVVLAALAGGLAVFVDVKLALAPMAGVLAWEAVRRRPESLTAFFHFLLALGVFEAMLGLFQHFVAPGWILGYVNDAYPISGTLINRNHFAGLLGMLIPVSIGLAYTSWVRYRDPARTYLYLLAGSVMGLALIFSLSRMGIFSFLVTLGVVSILIRWSHSRRLGSVLALVPLLLVMAGAAWIGVDVVVERFARLIGPDGVVREARVEVFRDTVRMIGEHPLGIGVGAYQDSFRRYQTTHNALLFDHAHNDYLETAAEWGIPIAALFWAWVFVVFGRTVRALLVSRDPGERGVLLTSVGAMFSILFHSLTDFNLQIPSNAMLFAVFLGVAVAVVGRGARGTEEESEVVAKPSALRLPLRGVLATISVAVIFQAWGPLLGAWITRHGVPEPGIYERALEYDPGNAEYHFVLAQIYHFSTPYLDVERARKHYLEAASINPSRSTHWLELSKFYEERDEPQQARDAMDRALDSDPNDAQTFWAAANLFIRLGDLPKADLALRRAADLDSSYIGQVLDLVWRFYLDADRVLSTHVPNTKAGNLTALRYFAAQNDADGIRLAWERLKGFETDPRERLSYVDFLVASGRGGEAETVFLGEDASDRPGFFNGGFETEPMNGGFDWRFSSGPALVRRDTTEFKEGFASLLIEFPGEENPAYSHVWHWLAVSRGRPYELRFWMRTEGVTTDEGVYLEVDGRGTDPVVGTSYWRQFTVPFTATSDLVTVRVRRDPTVKLDNLLAGRVWLDGFEIAELH
jgi:O-antigen ligase